MTTTMSLSNQSELCSSLMARRRVITAMEASGMRAWSLLLLPSYDLRLQRTRGVIRAVCVCVCVFIQRVTRLSLGQSGGQRLDQSGGRVQRWSWGSLGLGSPTPLRPLFLSLNKNIGVRVLGRDQVFVSFLCCGQRARFSVGICCVQVSTFFFFTCLLNTAYNNKGAVEKF